MYRMTLFRLATLGFFCCIAAGIAQDSSRLFTRLPVEQTGIRFSNDVIEDENFNINVFIYAYNGGGVAAGDVNNDGLIDLYFSGTQSHSSNRLYINKGNMRFEDVSAAAGVNDSLGVRYGVVMADINADGWLDIYVNKQDHPNALYINNKNGTFTERAKEFGLDYCCSSTQTAFLDYDLDGDLDAYIGVNGIARGNDYTNKGLNDRFLRNNGDGTFTDVTEQAGLVDKGYALSVSVGDVNNDGWPDIYITNDFDWRDILYINNKNGTFAEATKTVMKHTTEFGMGSDIADFNNDGLLDIVAVDMLPEDHWRKMSNMGSQNSFSPLFDSTQMMRNTLQLNRGNGMFSEIAQLSGIDETDWSWSPLFADYDQDGLPDLYISNGYKRDVANRDVIEYFTRASPISMLKRVPTLKLKNYAYRNKGDLTFEKVSDEWGLGDFVNSNGAMYADLDNDGDLDLVINNLDTTAAVYRNNANELGKGNWLQVKLQGTGKNPGGIGARVQIRYGNRKTQVREFSATRGYLSSTQDKLHFGLGDVSMVDRVLITWPDGSAQVLEHIKANQVITLRRKDASGGIDLASLRGSDSTAVVIKTFTELDSTYGLNYAHTENPFDDFNRERLMPTTLSRNGPGVAIGDINGDGLSDVYFGASRNKAGKLYLQTSPGRFAYHYNAVFDQDSACEDMGALFLDADGDGDPDLYIASGGNEAPEGDSTYQDRLYVNDGQGNFTRNREALPEMRVSTASVAGADYDADGDIDLFVAGRCVPGRYPDFSRSFLLENRGGKFADVTEEVAPSLLHPGMVTSALWSDYDGDGRPDLVLAGEWMGIHFYRNEEGKRLTDVVSGTPGNGLDSVQGWWHSLSAGDFDNDGDMDYIAGNMGLNTTQTLQPTQEFPVQLYANDFDNNTSRDLVMSYFYAGREFPARGRAAMISQMGTYMKRKFPSFTPYSVSQIKDIFDSTKLANAVRLAATTFFNAYIENLGNGKFRIHRLPTLAQASPMFGTVVGDFNADGNLDVLAMENFYGPDREVIRYDAGFGLYLAGDGKGGFTEMPVNESGFYAPHDGRSIGVIDVGSDTVLYVVAVNNNAFTQVFRHGYGPFQGKLLKVDPKKGYTHAIIEFEDGRTRREEFPVGSGYLSQSSHLLLATPEMKSITFYRGKEKEKTSLLIDEQMFGSDK